MTVNISSFRTVSYSKHYSAVSKGKGITSAFGRGDVLSLLTAQPMFNQPEANGSPSVLRNKHSASNTEKSNLVEKVDKTQLVPLLNPPLGGKAASQPFSLQTSTICIQFQPDLGMFKVHGKKQTPNWESENPISSLNFAGERPFGFRLSKQQAPSLTMRNACSKDYFRSGRVKVIVTLHRDTSSWSTAQGSYSVVPLAIVPLRHFRWQARFPCSACSSGIMFSVGTVCR